MVKSLYHVVGIALKAVSKSAKALKSVTMYVVFSILMFLPLCLAAKRQI